MAKKRLFFGLSVDESSKVALAKVQSESGFTLNKPVIPENFHVTLCFLGIVDEQLIPTLQKLARDIQVSSFELSISQIGLFPSAKVMWLGPDERTRDTPALLSLASQCKQIADLLEIPVSERAYRPHITLDRKATHLPDNCVFSPIDITFSSFSLFESRSTERGVRYIPLSSWPLIN